MMQNYLGRPQGVGCGFYSYCIFTSCTTARPIITLQNALKIPQSASAALPESCSKRKYGWLPTMESAPGCHGPSTTLKIFFSLWSGISTPGVESALSAAAIAELGGDPGGHQDGMQVQILSEHCALICPFVEEFNIKKMESSCRLHMRQVPHSYNGSCFSIPHFEATQLSLSLCVSCTSWVAAPALEPW